MALVEVAAVSKSFPETHGSGLRTAIESVSFEVSAGEVVCIVGKTGCGKSTLVNMLLGIDEPTEGAILIEGISPSGGFMELRRRVAAVFQTDRLLPWRTVLDNAALGLEAAGVGKRERRIAARPWLERVGLGNWAHHFPHQLSGGMRQRVAISRALVLEPAVIILDEAFGHLDEVTAQQLRHDCLGLIHETGKAAVVVTHNIREAIDIGNRVLVLGRPARVLRSYELTGLKESPGWEETSDRLRNEIFQLIEDQSGN